MMAGVRACSTGGDRTGLDLDIDTERRFCRNAEPGKGKYPFFGEHV